MELTCRVCLQVQELMVHIYEEVEDFQSNLCILLEQCGGLKVEKDDPYPKFLCKECTSELLIAAKFREKCTHSLEILSQVKADLQEAAQQEQILLAVAEDEFENVPDNETNTEEQVYIGIDEIDDRSQTDVFMPLDYEQQFEVGTDVEPQQIEVLEPFIDEVELEEEVDIDVGSEIVSRMASPEQQDASESEHLLVPMNQINDVEEDTNVSTLTVSRFVSKRKCNQSKRRIRNFNYPCDICGASFMHITNLRRHMEKTHMSEQLYSCEICKYCCRSEERFQEHCKSCGNEQDSLGQPETSLVGTKEGAAVKSKTATNPSNSANTNTCSYCGKQMQSPSALKMHERIHTGDRPYACEYCEKSFKTQSALKTHCKRHAGQADYACNVCGKKFYETSNLNAHMRTHTDDRPHKCTICEKSFTRVFLLQLHMRTHTKEKPYQCHICDRAFAQLCDLKSHFRTHTGEKRYRCPACSKTFNHNQTLAQHWEKSHVLNTVETTVMTEVIADETELHTPDRVFDFDDFSSDETVAATKELQQSLNLSNLIEEHCIENFITN